MNDFRYKRLCPFKWYVLQNFPFIEADFDALTNYQLYCKIVEYLNKVIDDMNIVGQQTENITNAMTELQNYVNNYFDNLDVQEEINNKLDDMLEQGTLQELVNNIFETIEDEIGDINKIIGLDNSNIVNALNVSDTNQLLHLGNSIIYDIPEVTGHIQGSCVNGSTLYVAVQGVTDENGTIYLFNIETNTYIGKYENIPFYHGNDMCYLNGKLYITEYDYKKICVYDISNGTSSEIDLSSINENILAGVEKYNNKLLCWAHTSNRYNLNNDIFYLINPISFEIEETFTVNDTYKLMNFINDGIVRQSCAIKNNTLYLLIQQPNVIVKCIFKNNQIVPTKLFNIPFYDKFNNPIGETEGISLIINQYYPEGSFMLTSRALQYKKNFRVYGNEHLHCYIINPYTNSVDFGNMAYGYYQRSYNRNEGNSVSKTATDNSLIEVGSSAYPFKDLIRGINSLQTNDHLKLYIRDSETYYLPYIGNYKNISINISNHNINPTIYFGDIDNSSIKIYNDMPDSTLTIKSLNDNKRITFLNSDIKIVGDNANKIIFEDCQVLLKGSSLNTRRCKFNNSDHMSSGFAIQVMDGSFFIDGFDDILLHTDDKFVNTVASGVAFIVNLSSHTYTQTGYSKVTTM